MCFETARRTVVVVEIQAWSLSYGRHASLQRPRAATLTPYHHSAFDHRWPQGRTSIRGILMATGYLLAFAGGQTDGA